jgi:DNA-binding transcriptional LysR family regulator
MELRHLRAFAAIAELHSFSKAARQLHVAQPPLSRQISQLERELGVKLFVRAASGVVLTREGSVLLEQARTVLADTAGFLDLASRARAGLANPLRVAMAPGMCEAVHRIRTHVVDRSPALVIEGVDMASSAQYDALRRKVMDVGLLRHVTEDPDIRSEPLFTERFVVMISERNPLARQKSLQLRQLAHERVLLQDRDWASLAHDRILSLFSAAGLTPRMVTLEATPGNQAAMLSVVSGETICFALRGPHSKSYQPVRGVAVLPLNEPNVEFEVQVAWRKGETSTLVCEFLRSARELFPQAPGQNPLHGAIDGSR